MEEMKAFFASLNTRFTDPMEEWTKKEYGLTITEIIERTEFTDKDLREVAKAFEEDDGIGCLHDIWEFLEDMARWQK